MGKKHKRRRRAPEKSSENSQASDIQLPLTKGLAKEIEDWAVHGCEIFGLVFFDMTYAPGNKWLVRVFVDRPGEIVRGQGVTVDECVQISRHLEALFESDARIPERYTLEVSSPGVERVLRVPRHFEMMLGSPVVVVTYEKIDGESRFEGILSHSDENHIIIESRDSGSEDQSWQKTLPYEAIKKARVLYDFRQQIKDKQTQK